jgi:hypothetical protein
MEALGIIAESMGELVSTCGLTRVGQYIQHTFKDTDPYVSCPFYMAGFFMGLEMNSTTPGVIPLDTKGSLRFVCGNAASSTDAKGKAAPASAQPVFGAPVAALSDDSVQALPINLGAAMGQSDASGFLTEFRARNDETYIPRMLEEDAAKLMSVWGPLQAFDAASAAKYDPGRVWISSCAEAFDNADVLRAVMEYKRRLADKFNLLQENDVGDDGVRMSVRAHLLSVVCHFHVPLPTQEHWRLTCARNLKLASGELPTLKKKTGSTLKSSCARVIS